MTNSCSPCSRLFFFCHELKHTVCIDYSTILSMLYVHIHTSSTHIHVLINTHTQFFDQDRDGIVKMADITQRLPIQSFPPSISTPTPPRRSGCDVSYQNQGEESIPLEEMNQGELLCFNVLFILYDNNCFHSVVNIQINSELSWSSIPSTPCCFMSVRMLVLVHHHRHQQRVMQSLKNKSLIVLLYNTEPSVCLLKWRLRYFVLLFLETSNIVCFESTILNSFFIHHCTFILHFLKIL